MNWLIDELTSSEYSKYQELSWSARLQNPDIGFSAENISSSFHADPELWCHDCEKCVIMREKLMDDRCDGDEDMTWLTDLSDCKIGKLLPGQKLMGDIDTLGWAVLKGYTATKKEDIVTLLKEKKSSEGED